MAEETVSDQCSCVSGFMIEPIQMLGLRETSVISQHNFPEFNGYPPRCVPCAKRHQSPYYVVTVISIGSSRGHRLVELVYFLQRDLCLRTGLCGPGAWVSWLLPDQMEPEDVSLRVEKHKIILVDATLLSPSHERRGVHEKFPENYAAFPPRSLLVQTVLLHE